MRHAPPVGAVCSGGLRWRGVRTGLAASAAGAVSAWLLQHVDITPVWGLVPMGLTGGLAWRLSAPRAVRLLWDGAAWRADDEPGRVDVMLDAAGLMLLRWHPASGRAGWIAVCRDETGRAWPALRAALYSPAASHRPDPLTPE